MNQDIVRVLRIYEFIGPRSKIEKQVAISIQGEKSFDGDCTIRAATLGTFPEIMQKADPALKLRKFYDEAKDFFPDNDSQRDGYQQAIVDIITKLERGDL